MRVLVIEDDVAIQQFLRQSLEEAGYTVDVAGDAATAEAFASRSRFEALIVDLGLPDTDGITLLLRLRRNGLRAPVLILSARRTVDDRVRGLEQGGDDYMVKPFALAELLARLRNLIRRGGGSFSEPVRLSAGSLQLDLLRREATVGGDAIALTQQEFALLEYMVRHAGRVVTRSMILSDVWGLAFQPETNVVDVHVYRLRGKLEADGRAPVIKTLRGVGYVLEQR